MTPCPSNALHPTTVSGFFRLALSLWCGYHRAECRFRPGIPIKEQRVIDSFPRKMVQPTAPVVQVPECDAGDGIRVPAKNAEELAILFSLPLQDLGRAAVGVRIELRQLVAMFAIVSPPSRSGDWVQV